MTNLTSDTELEKAEAAVDKAVVVYDTHIKSYIEAESVFNQAKYNLSRAFDVTSWAQGNVKSAKRALYAIRQEGAPE